MTHMVTYDQVPYYNECTISRSITQKSHLTRTIADPDHISADITEENLELGHSAVTSRLLSSAMNH